MVKKKSMFMLKMALSRVFAGLIVLALPLYTHGRAGNVAKVSAFKKTPARMERRSGVVRGTRKLSAFLSKFRNFETTGSTSGSNSYSGSGYRSTSGDVTLTKTLVKTSFDRYGNVIDSRPVGTTNPWLDLTSYGGSGNGGSLGSGNGGSSGSGNGGSSGGDETLVKTLVKTTYDRYGNEIETTIVDGKEYKKPVYCYGSHCTHSNPFRRPLYNPVYGSPHIFPAPAPRPPTFKPRFAPTPHPVTAPAPPTPPTPMPFTFGTDPIIPRPPTAAPSPSLGASSPNSNSQQGGPFPGQSGPTGSPVDILDSLKPPDTVVESTRSPVESPTFMPTKNYIFQKTIRTDPISYETIGAINLVTVEKQFFEQTQFLFTSYLAKHVGNLLQTYQLVLTFQEIFKVEDQSNIDDAQELYYNIFDARIRLDLKGTQERLDAITKDFAHGLVSNFFTGNNLKELLEWLDKKGIQVRDIRLHHPSEAQTPSGKEEEGQGQGEESPSEHGSDDDSSLIMLVTLLCGSAILAALLILTFVKRRRARRFHYHGNQNLESPMGSVYSNGTGSVASAIRPAAIQKQKKKAVSARTEDIEGAYNEPYPDLDPNFARDHLLAPLTPSSDTGTDSDYDRRERFQDELDNPRNESLTFKRGAEGTDQLELNPFDFAYNPNAATGATLTSIDDEGSLNGMDHEYPEFEMFVNNTPKGEDYVQRDHPSRDQSYEAQRKRWQEEAIDPGLLGLPDHDRSSSYTDGEQSSGDDSPNLVLL